MGYAAQIFEGSVLLLERISHRVAFSQHLYPGGLYLDGLAASERFHELALYGNAGAGGHLLKQILREGCLVHYHLYIIDAGTIIQCDERYAFVTSFRSYPRFGEHIGPRLHPEQVLDFGSFDSFHFSISYISWQKYSIPSNYSIS